MSAAESRGRMASPASAPVSLISPQAVVSPGARLGRNVEVGPFAVIGDDVELGDGCVLHAHAVVEGPSRIGRQNVFYPFSSVGAAPQDRKYHGEPTRLEMGDRNVFREFVTVNRGTAEGAGVTRIGNDNLILAYSHIAHDCIVGSHTLFVNGATLAGHVIVEDYATVGAFCPVHQFCRIGRHAYIAANTVITQDVLPFSKTVAPRETRCFGVNTLGLERAGFSKERITSIEQAFRLLLRSKLNTAQAVEQMRAELSGNPDVEELLRFIESAERGIAK
jgi:UDP-N-acetylglucosamine acyltransferase